MFGGTPSNLGMTFETDKVEVITGVNLPMLIKLASLGHSNNLSTSREIREDGRNAIWVANSWRPHDMTSRTVIVQPTACARATIKSCTSLDLPNRIVVSQQGVTWTAKSIMGLLLLAAARRTIVTIAADGPDEDAAIEALTGPVAL